MLRVGETCGECGKARVDTGNTRIVFTDAELAMVEKVLEERCFPCWKYENIISRSIAGLEAKLNKLRKKYPGLVARIPKNRRYG